MVFKPNSIFYVGLGVVVVGIAGILVLDRGRSGDNSAEAGETQKGRSVDISRGKERRSLGRLPGDGVGTRRMDRNEILEVGRRLRWELNPLRRRAALGQLLEGLNKNNAMLVREQIIHFSEESPEFQDFHFAWGAMSGIEAVSMGTDTKEKDMAATLTGWASVDPIEALAWHDGLTEYRRNCRDVKFGMLEGLASSDLAFATEFAVEKMESGDTHAAEMMNFIKERMLEAETMSATARWALELPEGKIRDGLLAEVTQEYATRKPQDAAQWVETLEGEERDRARMVVADRWAREDPVASLQWARALPDGEAKNSSVGAVFSQWAEQDADAAYDFLNRMPPTGERDAAVDAFSNRIGNEDPQSAIAWANEIQDGETRRAAMIRAGRALMRKDPDEGRRWLDESGLSGEVKKEISGE